MKQKPERGRNLDHFLIIILTFAIIIVVLAIVYIITVPKEGERFTEFFILGEKQKAADYPALMTTGQNYPMFIGVGNHESLDVAYTIETWLLQTQFDNVTNTSRILAMDPNDHVSFTLADNETTIIPYNLSIKKTGYNRVEFLLFNESIPGMEMTGSDRINTSYRNLHLIVDVEEAESQELSG